MERATTGTTPAQPTGPAQAGPPGSSEAPGPIALPAPGPPRRPAPRRGWSAVLAAARATSAGRPRGVRLVLMVALVCLPLLVEAIVLAVGDAGRSFVFFLGFVHVAYFALALPLLMLFLGSAALGDEWDGGTAPYVAGLPLPRSAIVLGRWMVVVRRGLLLVVPPMLVLYALCLYEHEGALVHYAGELAWILAGVCLLGFGYAGIFLFLGLALRRPLLASFVVYMAEMSVSFLPEGFARLTLSYHVRNLLWLHTGQPHFLDEGLRGAASGTTLRALLGVALHVVVFLTLSTLVLRRKECGGGVAPPDGTGATTG